MARRVGPTHFLSLRLDPAFFSAFGDAVRQSHLTSAGMLVEPRTSHITTLLLDLNERTTGAALEAFQRLGERRTPLGPMTLRFRGVSTFGNRVVFAIPENDDATESVCRLAAELLEYFAVGGFTSAANDKEFTPHCTLMKTNRSSPKRIDPHVYSRFADHDFGSCQTTTIDFCSMRGPKTDGYYQTLAQIPL
ncbi:Solute carrier 7 member 3 [Polyrhizophydium stewartii]|uniref:Solute carrier 7 member 3 n=1 Tax=Polyrhizophydium stewartii TaxID=2732419 RepID=A0ABR4N2Z2_9FUNG